jgi:hypothetical protein
LTEALQAKSPVEVELEVEVEVVEAMELVEATVLDEEEDEVTELDAVSAEVVTVCVLELLVAEGAE